MYILTYTSVSFRMIIYMKYFNSAFYFMSPRNIVHHNNTDWWLSLDVKDLFIGLRPMKEWLSIALLLIFQKKRKRKGFSQHACLWGITFQTGADVCLSSSVVYAAHNVEEDTREKLSQRPVSKKNICRVVCVCEGLCARGFDSTFMHSIGTLLSPIM